MGAHELAARLKNADTEAQSQVDTILEMSCPASEEIYPYVRNYIMIRFLLDEHEVQSDVIRDMASTSVAHMLSIPLSEMETTDLSDRCISAPSVETKIVLLLMRLERELGIKLEVMERVEAKTVRELSDKIAYHLNKVSHP